MKLAIVGSRTFNKYNDYTLLSNTVYNHFHSFHLEIISGGAKGADTLGHQYAKDRDLDFTIFSANWDVYGKSAGFRRNQQIVDACDIVLAFWDGKSKGTQDTINKAKKAKKPTFIVYF